MGRTPVRSDYRCRPMVPAWPVREAGGWLLCRPHTHDSESTWNSPYSIDPGAWADYLASLASISRGVGILMGGVHLSSGILKWGSPYEKPKPQPTLCGWGPEGMRLTV